MKSSKNSKLNTHGPSKVSFYFHYNKPASRVAKRPQISIHYSKKCVVVDDLESFVPLKGRIRKTQPFWVLTGRGQIVIIDRNGLRVAIISPG